MYRDRSRDVPLSRRTISAGIGVKGAAGASRRRRHEEQKQRGGNQTLAEVQAALARRDEIDSSRDLSPLRPADDAVIMDTTALTPEDILVKLDSLLGVD